MRKDSGIISKSEARRKGLWDLHESAAKCVSSYILGSFQINKLLTRYDLFLSIHYMWQAYMAELFNLPPATLKNLANPTMPQASSMHPKLVKADFHGAIITGKHTPTLSTTKFPHLTFHIVAEAKNADLVGLSGIVVHETENTFKIVTKKNQFKSTHSPSLYKLYLPKCSRKVIPKQNSVFTFRVPIYAPATQQIQPPGPNESPSGVPSAGPVSKEEALPSTFRPLDTVPCAEFQLYGNQFRFRSADRVNKKFKHKETIALI